MNKKKIFSICFFIFFVIVSKQIFAYQQDIVIKYDNIFSSKVLSEEEQSVVSIGASHYIENYKKYKQVMNSDENK